MNEGKLHNGLTFALKNMADLMPPRGYEGLP